MVPCNITPELDHIIRDFATTMSWSTILDAHCTRTGKAVPVFDEIIKSITYETIKINCGHVYGCACEDVERTLYTASCSWEGQQYKGDTFAEEDCAYNNVYHMIIQKIVKEELAKNG